MVKSMFPKLIRSFQVEVRDQMFLIRHVVNRDTGQKRTIILGLFFPMPYVGDQDSISGLIYEHLPEDQCVDHIERNYFKLLEDRPRLDRIKKVSDELANLTMHWTATTDEAVKEPINIQQEHYKAYKFVNKNAAVLEDALRALAALEGQQV